VEPLASQQMKKTELTFYLSYQKENGAVSALAGGLPRNAGSLEEIRTVRTQHSLVG